MKTEHIVWGDDWRDRIAHAVRNAGASSLLEFLSARPGIAYSQILPDFSPRQIRMVHFEEAKEAGNIRDAVIDSLVRTLALHMPEGWGNEGESAAIVTISGWLCELDLVQGRKSLGDSLCGIRGCLNELKLPDDWVPRSSEDQYLMAVFDRLWPRDEEWPSVGDDLNGE